ncbi:hypothetical protein BLA29_006137 [Euroglyphus maynei]|uniref:Uncharacterized protein n=1 Tax=Euroglyphus maynei TaxID=6958 RepID=A0A1Y3BB90_EURMA|nr:hypothetical protein BLA29_006137 [Euroglyphus maynei]
MSIILEKFTKIHFNLPWLVFQAFTNQSVKYPTINWFGINFFIQICWWSGMFLNESYSSMIISKLTDSQSYNVISNVQQFSTMTAQQKIIPIMSDKSPYFRIFEKYKNIDKIYRILDKYLIKADSYDEAFYKMIKHRYNLEFGEENVSKSNSPPIYSVIGTFKNLNMYAKRLGSQYFIYTDDIQTAFFTDYYGLMFRANSTMIPYFNRCIKKARDHGFFVKWFVYDQPVWRKKFPELDTMLLRLNRNRKLGDASVFK